MRLQPEKPPAHGSRWHVRDMSADTKAAQPFVVDRGAPAPTPRLRRVAKPAYASTEQPRAFKRAAPRSVARHAMAERSQTTPTPCRARTRATAKPASARSMWHVAQTRQRNIVPRPPRPQANESRHTSRSAFKRNPRTERIGGVLDDIALEVNASEGTERRRIAATGR